MRDLDRPAGGMHTERGRPSELPHPGEQPIHNRPTAAVGQGAPDLQGEQSSPRFRWM